MSTTTTPEAPILTRFSRWQDALFIQSGACNPSGVARALVKACDAARQDKRYHEGGEAFGQDWRRDPAIQLILHQLCFLAGIGTTDYVPVSSPPNSERLLPFDYNRATDVCEAEVAKENHDRR